MCRPRCSGAGLSRSVELGSVRIAGCGSAMGQAAGQFLLSAVSRVPPPSRLHPVSIPSPHGVAFMAAITLGEAVRVVAVWAAAGFAGLPGPA